MISGHLGLAVMVRKRSGLWKCLQMAIASWNNWVINLELPVRATGAPDSRRILSNITVYNYDTTHLQENPQRLG